MFSSKFTKKEMGICPGSRALCHAPAKVQSSKALGETISGQALKCWFSWIYKNVLYTSVKSKNIKSKSNHTNFRVHHIWTFWNYGPYN